jgi:hypothetical protein
MIIIEEDETEKKNVDGKTVNDMEEEELTPEEQGYRSAVELMESVDCVVRYERGVQSLQNAADQFRKLEGYRDSQEREKKCRRQALELEEKGREAAYREAVTLCENAVTKMDYRTAISELNRFPDYKDCGKRIEDCKGMVTAMETKQVRRNRVIVLIFVLLFLFAAYIFYLTVL